MADLITLSDYKDAHGITDTSRDGEIAAAIGPASQAIINFAGRNFGSTVVTEDRLFEYDGSGYLDIDDTATINSVAFTVPGFPDYVLTTDNWQAMPPRRADAPLYSYIILPGLYGGYPGSPEMGFTRNLDIVAAEGRLRGLPVMVKVNAAWGWSSVPSDVKQAVIWTIDEWLARPHGEGLTSESIADLSYSWGRQNATAPASAIPQRAQDILAQYAKLTV